MSAMNEYLRLDLQLFAEGGAAGGDGGAEGTTAESGIASATKGSKNPLANVVYGRQEEGQQIATATTGDNGTVAPDPRQAKFESLIKGEYKDLYDSRVQDTVQKRLKGAKETVEKYEKITPMLEMLGRKYGVDPSDADALNRAIEEDDSYYEDEALEKGITVEQLKEIKKMERENSELKAQMQQRQNQERAERDVAMWMEQARDAQAQFPGLDLRAELQNPEFIKLLRSGIDVGTAYFALHHKTLVPQAMQYTAKTVQQKLTNNVIANGARPVENGMNAQAPAMVKNDVTMLTKADRQEIARRVARGERIVF